MKLIEIKKLADKILKELDWSMFKKISHKDFFLSDSFELKAQKFLKLLPADVNEKIAEQTFAAWAFSIAESIIHPKGHVSSYGFAHKIIAANLKRIAQDGKEFERFEGTIFPLELVNIYEKKMLTQKSRKELFWISDTELRRCIFAAAYFSVLEENADDFKS